MKAKTTPLIPAEPRLSSATRQAAVPSRLQGLLQDDLLRGVDGSCAQVFDANGQMVLGMAA